jgi:eukaryotic-like serine/threonine-protein kinase
MRRAAIVAVVVLAGCSGPSTAKPSTSPTTSATPVAISTGCPAAGKAAAAVLTPLTLGNHPTIIYSDEPSANGGPVVSSLIRYDVTTGAKAEILKTTVSEAEVSPDGHWIALATFVSGLPALQLVRTDGQYLQTVFCGQTNGSIRGILWSSDLKSLLFSASGGSGPAPIYRLDLNKGTLDTPLRNNSLSTDYAPLSWVDANRMLLVGRPIGPGPGYDLRLLDLTQGASQQASDLPLVVSSSADCWDADNDGTTVYTSACQGAFNDAGGGTMRGPSTIGAQSAIGGQKRVVFNSPTLAVTQLRAVGSNQLLLSVGNQDPARSSAGSMNGLWKVNTDGSGLTRLAPSAGKQGQFAVYSQAAWANVSRDASLYAFLITSLGKPPSYSLVAGPMAGGQPTTIATRTDGGLLLMIGWTSS